MCWGTILQGICTKCIWKYIVHATFLVQCVLGMDLVTRLPFKFALTRAYVTSLKAHGPQIYQSEDIINNCQHIVIMFDVIVE
jgi:hypothetical protein